MTNHPAVERVIERISADTIGGAADTAKEVLAAMAQVAKDSNALTINSLYDEIELAALAVMKACSSLAPPINVLHRIMRTLENDVAAGADAETAKKHLLESVDDFMQRLNKAMDMVADIGAALIKNNHSVFMYSMSSTIWKVLRKAKQQGKDFKVLVTESRPANEGLWTVAEMNKSHIPVEVSIDTCLPEMIKTSDIVFAGVDAVAANGTVLNKTGTYLCALVAREYGVPFYFVSDTLKFDTSTLFGLPFKSDPIHYHEVMGDKKFDEGVKVVGKVFDETPPHLITGIITELGIIPPSACINVMWEMKLSKRISELLPKWANGNL